MNNSYVLLSIAIMSLVTIAIRFAPFILLNGKKTPEVINYLGKVLPCAIMMMLVVYCIKDTQIMKLDSFLPTLIASLLTILSYCYKKNTLLSIIFGTVVYMVLVQIIF